MGTATSENVQSDGRYAKPIKELPGAAVRFAGDSGDGMQLAGSQFTATSAVFGNDVATFPDFPAEIRAPIGTLAGVSGFQINFSSRHIYTPGDKADVLVAMNPAALKVCLPEIVGGGILIVNSDEFNENNLQRAKIEQNPLETDELQGYQLFKVPISSQTLAAVKETGLGPRDAGRCKNFYALGILYWLFDRPLEPTLRWINNKFGKVPAVAQANTLALKAGYNFGETAEIFTERYRVKPAALRPGTYRNVTGNQATAYGFIAAAQLAKKPLFYGSYPITPASEILHELSQHKRFDVRVFQAEDEIAAMCSVVGAAFSGALAISGTSGPGMALKQEAIGLGVMTELPMVIVNVQRGGPSTGLPTKTEQSDLWQAIVGRNGECPLPVLAARSPADCFWSAIEATRIAVKYMTPVVLLTDGYLAQGSEPWRIPEPDELKPIPITHPTETKDFHPYARDEFGARPWAIPGTPGLHHRIGGLEKADVTGNVCYVPENHQRMTDLRQQKVDGVVRDIPDQEVFGDASGRLLVVSWGGTFGAVRTAIEQIRDNGQTDVSHVHLRWLNPMPKNLGEILKRFDRVLACELNMGQLQMLLRGRYLVDVLGLHKVKGRPFMVQEVVDKVNEVLGGSAS
jgi:2-oxoglutarate ferredoxin oxidoreductase subunit alpha